MRGAFWTILSGTGARIVGILGTLAVTHYLTPDQYGEISIAALVTLTASTIANAGISQYIASKPDAERAAVFHATFYYLLLGVVALGLVLLVSGPFSVLVNAPTIGRFLPVLAIATMIDRVSMIQDRIQVRDMRFRSVGLIRTMGEFGYASSSVAFAALGAGTVLGGGNALMWATMVRSLVRLALLSATTPFREWAEPHPITAARTREFFNYGLPMSLAIIANFGSSKFDNFVYSHHFGEGAVGQYNAIYNFADMPAVLVAETVGDVLVPSFAKMESDARRRDAFLLALRTLVLLVTPMAMGLVMVAPDLVRAALSPAYEGSIPLLRILSLLAVPRTIIWTSVSYLQVNRDPRGIMVLEWMRVIVLVVFMHLITFLARAMLGEEAARYAACSAVVLVFALSSLSYLALIRRVDGVRLRDQILPLLPPTLACIPMMLAVYGTSTLLPHVPFFAVEGPTLTFATRIRAFGPRLFVEMVVGAIAFVPSALALSPTASRHFLRMLGQARARRRGDPATS